MTDSPFSKDGISTGTSVREQGLGSRGNSQRQGLARGSSRVEVGSGMVEG